jgi:formylglycine-generating enzyme required for sulfatase activity
VVRTVTNRVGALIFTDVTGNLVPQKFYQLLLQSPPANMVFISPNTFTMGSPTNDLQAKINERPQTTVTLTHGFWIGKYEVTQGEYLSVMNTNLAIPDDLSRPVQPSRFDATNYRWKLPNGSCYWPVPPAANTASRPKPSGNVRAPALRRAGYGVPTPRT